ncbi:ankyrin-3-like [Saccostrea echinata]|uniref:ankyrin-3-like n=1 Tax=Saccostrea echinata TaxID=191078 RepID=UPI002A7F2D71|nr:ankyrin-3-like [Saccostrea echinata]
MSEHDEEFSMMHNFMILNTHFKIDLAKFLGNVLQLCWRDTDNLRKHEMFNLLDKGSQTEISRRNSFVLSFPVLCEIFLKGICGDIAMEQYMDSEVLQDVARLQEIWKVNIFENDVEKISNDGRKQIWGEIEGVGERMAQRFEEVGKIYLESIRRYTAEEKERDPFAVQIGDENRMDVKFEEESRAPIFIQVGKNNKIIINLEDRRTSEQLRTSERVKLRMVLRSNNASEWKEITENMLKMDLHDLNSNIILKENDIVIDDFEKGCLVINFNISGGNAMKNFLKTLFEVIFQEVKVETTLRKYEASSIHIYGYFYRPEEFQTKDASSSQNQNVSLYCHHSWENGSTVCDVDIYLTDLMRNLIITGFSTDVDELIELQIRYDTIRLGSTVVPPTESTQPLFTENFGDVLNDIVKSSLLHLHSLDTTNSTTRIVFKCKGKMLYANFVEGNGIISNISKTINVPRSLLRVSFFIDTNFVNDSLSDQGLIFYLNPLSKVSDAIKSGKFPRIVTAMLEGKDPSLLQNVGELKLKAVLEYQEEKGPFLPAYSKSLPPKLGTVASAESKDNLREMKLKDTLLKACKMGNPNLVQQILEQGENPNFPNEKLQNPIHIAAEGNHVRVLEQLLLHGAEIDVFDLNHETPLIIASRKGNWKIITELLKQGAGLEFYNNEKHTALYVAVEHGHRYAISNLLKFGANINSVGNDQCTPLHIACKKENQLIIRELLSYGADLHCNDSNRNSPLHTVLQWSNDESKCLSIVDELLKNGASINRFSDGMKTPLCIASEKGFGNIVRLLLSKDADCNLSDVENNLPFHLASKNGHKKVIMELIRYCNFVDRCNANTLTPRRLASEHQEIQMLFNAHDLEELKELPNDVASLCLYSKKGMVNEIEANIKHSMLVDSADANKRTLLFIASENGHLDTVRLLVNSGASIDEFNSFRRTPLSVAAENRFESIVEFLIQSGADSNIMDDSGKTPLHYAVKSGSSRIADVLLQRGKSVYKGDFQGKTPLHFCGKYGSVSVAKLFLAAGFNVYECDLEGKSAMEIAIENAEIEIAELLISHGAHINISDIKGRSPLHLAAENGSISAVEILLNGGANINQRDKLNQTPLFVATEKGRSVLKIFINRGADLNLCDTNGRSPLHAALEGGHLFAMKILVKHNANVNLADQEGMTPLHLASQLGNVEGVEILLTANANVNSLDINGRSPLHYCSLGLVAKRLLQHGAEVNAKDKEGKSPLHVAVEMLCAKTSTVTNSIEFLAIINEVIVNGANICLHDNEMKTVIHKTVYADHVHLLIELLSYNIESDIKENLVRTVNDILKQMQQGNIRIILEHWMDIQRPTEKTYGADIHKTECCPPSLYQKHLEWLREHKCFKRANILQRVISSERSQEARKRKESCGESSLIEPLEKVLRVEGEQNEED